MNFSFICIPAEKRIRIIIYYYKLLYVNKINN
jgi:hypothetical protein